MGVGLLRLVQLKIKRASASRGWPFEVVHSMMRVIEMVREESTISLPESALPGGWGKEAAFRLPANAGPRPLGWAYCWMAK